MVGAPRTTGVATPRQPGSPVCTSSRPPMIPHCKNVRRPGPNACICPGSLNSMSRPSKQQCRRQAKTGVWISSVSNPVIKPSPPQPKDWACISAANTHYLKLNQYKTMARQNETGSPCTPILEEDSPCSSDATDAGMMKSTRDGLCSICEKAAVGAAKF